MFRLFKYLSGKDLVLVCLCVGLVAVQVFFDLQLPEYTKQITVLVSEENRDINQYLITGGKMLALTFGSIAVSVIVGLFAAKVAADFSFTIRDRVFRKITQFSNREINKFTTASLITRTTNDITQVQTFVAAGLQVFIRAPIMAVWAIQKILEKSLTLSMLVVAAVVILLTLIIVLMIIMIPKFRQAQRQIDDVNRIARENLTGLKVVHAFNAEKFEERKFKRANVALTRTQLFTMRGLSVLFPVMVLVQSALSLLIYWVGAHLITGMAISDRPEFFGDVVAFNSYAIYVIMSFVMMMVLLIIFPRAQVSASRICAVLVEPTLIKEGQTKNITTKTTGELEFKDVTFRHFEAEQDCLSDLSFKVERGQTLAFIGATGSGKSTIVNLISRLADPDLGEILLDGVPIQNYKFKQLYSKIGVIPQRPTLFTGTIRSNLTFGDRKITDTELHQALKIAKADDFVEKLGGLDAKISQGGTNLSGGQKQRLAIARAIARRPEILIFDDAFSALDYQTDRQLRDNIKQQLTGTTCVIVAQRVGTIKTADNIVVLNNGRVTASGTHAQLMRKSKLYREIASSQLNQTEDD